MDSSNAARRSTSLTVAVTQAIAATTNVTTRDSCHSIGKDSSFSTTTHELRENSSLSQGSATVLILPSGAQMAYITSNEPQINSARPGMNYVLPNTRPPGAANFNYGYEHDLSSDLKDVNPPSYEEAIKAMEYQKENPVHHIVPNDTDHFQHHHYSENGQFGVQDQYFYPQSYRSCNTSDVEDDKGMSICTRLVCTTAAIGVIILVLRMFFFKN